MLLRFALTLIFWLSAVFPAFAQTLAPDGLRFAPVESFAFDGVVPVDAVPRLSLDLRLLALELDHVQMLKTQST